MPVSSETVKDVGGIAARSAPIAWTSAGGYRAHQRTPPLEQVSDTALQATHQVNLALLAQERNLLASRVAELKEEVNRLESDLEEKSQRIAQQEAQLEQVIENYERVIAEKNQATME